MNSKWKAHPRLTELSITSTDDNKRQIRLNLTDGIVKELDQEIIELKALIESERRGIAKWLQK